MDKLNSTLISWYKSQVINCTSQSERYKELGFKSLEEYYKQESLNYENRIKELEEVH